MSIHVIDPASFFGDGIDKINENFDTIQQTVTSVKATEDTSALSTPVPMTMGADNQHWLKPSGAVGPYVVFDHGFVLRKTQYSEVNGQVVLGYVPSNPYAITIAWNVSSAGVTAPVALTQHATLGNRFWVLPDDVGVNVWVFDHGRLLKQGDYTVTGKLVELDYVPVGGPFDISASWGAGGPGMTAPVLMAQVTVGSLDTANFYAPPGCAPTLLVQDHGLMLDVNDYVYNRNTGVVTLNYAAAEPLDVTACWGFPLDGTYIPELKLSPLGNGTLTSWILPTDPLPGTLSVRVLLSGGTYDYAVPGVDYTVDGRTINFLAAIPSGATVFVSLSTCTLVDVGGGQNPVIGTVNQSVTSTYGVELDVDTVSVHNTYNVDGSLATTTWLDGVTTIKTATYTYNGSGQLATLAVVALGRTVTHTFAYDVNGGIEDITKVVT